MAKFTGKELFEYVSQHQGCYANDICKAKGVDRDLLLSTFRNCVRSKIPIRREGVGDNLRYFTEVEDNHKKTTLSDAIALMIQAITQQVREEVDTQLDLLITAEVNEALADVQNRIRVRLSGQMAQPVAPVATVAPVEQSVAQPTLPVTQPIEPFNFDSVPDGPTQAVHNIKSKRTTAKTKPVVTPSVAENPPEPAKKQVVVIIGIHANKQPLIRREFKDCFDLRMLNPDQYNRIAGVLTADSKNIVMLDFVGHRHSDAVMAAGHESICISGGMTTLRETLTAIFVGER